MPEPDLARLDRDTQQRVAGLLTGMAASALAAKRARLPPLVGPGRAGTPGRRGRGRGRRAPVRAAVGGWDRRPGPPLRRPSGGGRAGRLGGNSAAVRGADPHRLALARGDWRRQSRAGHPRRGRPARGPGQRGGLVRRGLPAPQAAAAGSAAGGGGGRRVPARAGQRATAQLDHHPVRGVPVADGPPQSRSAGRARLVRRSSSGAGPPGRVQPGRLRRSRS